MRRFVSFWVAVALFFCSGMAVAQNNMDSLPRVDYTASMKRVILDKALVEGKNQIIFAFSPEEKAKYIPKTTWRETEKAAAEEFCALTLVSTQGVDAEETARFLRGESEELKLKEGDFFLVALAGPYWLTEMQVDATGETVATLTDESMRKKYERISLSGASTLYFTPSLLCNYLMIAASENGGDVCLHGLNIKGKPTLGVQIIRKVGDNSVVLDAKDASNPISLWRTPLRQSHYRLAAQLLMGMDKLSAHQKMMVFMEYIADFYVGSDSRNNRETCERTYIGACGFYSALLAALAFTQGIPARLLTMANYPENTGHAVCEVFYDGHWHLYDPTYGAYFTKTPEEVKNPLVLSFDELSQGAGNTPAITCIVTSPHRLIEKSSYGFLGPRIYEEAMPKGVIGLGHPMVYPLSMHFDGVRTLLTQVDFSNKYQGINYIGAASINNMHKWRLSGLEAGKRYEFIVTASGVYGEKSQEPFMAKAASEDARLEEGMKHCFVNADTDSMQWRISFVPDSDTAHILLKHNYHGLELHYVWFTSFELRKAD